MNDLEQSKGKLVKWIDDLVADLERMRNITIPPENRKTPYTRACWALSILQGTKQLGSGRVETPNVDRLIASLRENLPFIKEMLA